MFWKIFFTKPSCPPGFWGESPGLSMYSSYFLYNCLLQIGIPRKAFLNHCSKLSLKPTVTFFQLTFDFRPRGTGVTWDHTTWTVTYLEDAMLVFLLQNFLRAERTCWTNLLTPECVFVLSHVQLFSNSRTVVHQAPLSMKFPGKNTELGCHFLLQGTFVTQGSNPCLLHLPYLQVDSLPPAPPGKFKHSLKL